MKELFVAVLFGATPCMLSLAAFAQDVYSIRVESNQVLVPTSVFDKTRLASTEPVTCPLPDGKSSDNERSGATPLASCSGDEVLGLTLKDFHLFEDGKEQKLQSITVERGHKTDVHDNVAEHDEYSNTPLGRWSTSDLRSQMGFGPSIPLRYYLIAYMPPPSAKGSCHQIRVKVDRHNTLVYARSRYCNSQQIPSDPLNGTQFSNEMEGNLSSSQVGKIGLSLQAGFFYTSADTARINIALEFPWDSLKRKWEDGSLYATIGILGTIRRKDGFLVKRFTDFACCPVDRPPFVGGDNPERAYPNLDVLYIPTRYETQTDLGSGEYTLDLVLSDSSKFGRLVTQFTVESYDAKQLAISSVELCKRFREASAKSQDDAANPAPKFVPLISKGIEYTPAGDTRFKKGEPLFAYFEVYEPLIAGQPSPIVQTRLKITNIKTGELKVDTGLRSEASTSAVIPIADQIAVDKLPAGSYRLEVQASDSAGKSTAWRAAEFMVE